MSTSYNNIKRSVAPKSLFESAKNVIDDTITWNQGDLITFSGGLLSAVNAAGDDTAICGVARQKIVLGKVASPYQGTAVDASQAIEDIAGPVFGVVAELTLKTGDALNPGDPVYLEGSDAQLVTATAGMGQVSVGIYQGAAISSATAGQKIEVLVGARYGLGALVV